MAKTITVKGIGKVSVKPDYVVLSMSLESKDLKYDKALELANQHIQHLNESLCAAGFKKNDVKTTRFNVYTDYRKVEDKNGKYHREFNGYVISHKLKVEFDFDMEKLSQALSSIADSLSHPELSIAFTVKDATAVSEEMLKSAAINARHKAEILCESSGVELGQLLNIDYNWNELDIFSHTQYSISDNSPYGGAPSIAKSITIEPDDIDVSDTATFVWGIK